VAHHNVTIANFTDTRETIAAMNLNACSRKRAPKTFIVHPNAPLAQRNTLQILRDAQFTKLLSKTVQKVHPAKGSDSNAQSKTKHAEATKIQLSHTENDIADTISTFI
jgi:hypothetical protein